jgi:hypothetical protein
MPVTDAVFSDYFFENLITNEEKKYNVKETRMLTDFYRSDQYNTLKN